MTTLLCGLMLRIHSYFTGVCYYCVTVIWTHDYLRVNELTLKFMGNIDRNKDTITRSISGRSTYWLHAMIMTATLYFQQDESNHLVFMHYWHYVYALSHTLTFTGDKDNGCPWTFDQLRNRWRAKKVKNSIVWWIELHYLTPPSVLAMSVG